MAKPECATLRECIEAELADCQVEAATIPLRNPVNMVVSEKTAEYSDAMIHAARWKIFLDVLDEVVGKDFEFNVATITTK